MEIRSIRHAINAQDNITLEVLIFKLLFFANLTSLGLKLKTESGRPQLFTKAFWPLDSEFHPGLFNGQSDLWIKPPNWSQADALLISPVTKAIYFFQITGRLQHDVALKNFADFLNFFDYKLNFRIVINVVVPIKNIRTIQLNVMAHHVMGMKKFKKGWSSEMNVVILGMEDILNILPSFVFKNYLI